MKNIFNKINSTLMVLAIMFALSTDVSAQRLVSKIKGVAIGAASRVKGSNGFDRKSSQGTCGVFFGYSQVNSKYEDDNIIAEIWAGGLYITNKTDRPIFINNEAAFMYINDESFSLYRDPQNKNRYVPYVESIAPKAKNVLIRYFRNPFSGKTFDAQGGGLSNKTVEFMNYMETLRSDLANAPDKTSSSLHLEQDESILTIKAAVNYAVGNNSLGKDDREYTQFIVSSWVSDIILSKYYVEPRNNNSKVSNAVSVRGRYKEVLHVFADIPFEYEEDRSPISYAKIFFNKGKFNTSFFDTSDENAQEAKNNEVDYDEAARTESTFIWEGHSGDYKTSLYDVVMKCMRADGVNLKDAEKQAEKITNDKVKEEVIRK